MDIYPLVICDVADIAIEHGPVEIVDFPIEHGGSFHGYIKLSEGSLQYFFPSTQGVSTLGFI